MLIIYKIVLPYRVHNNTYKTLCQHFSSSLSVKLSESGFPGLKDEQDIELFSIVGWVSDSVTHQQHQPLELFSIFYFVTIIRRHNNDIFVYWCQLLLQRSRRLYFEFTEFLTCYYLFLNFAGIAFGL